MAAEVVAVVVGRLMAAGAVVVAVGRTRLSRFLQACYLERKQ